MRGSLNEILTHEIDETDEQILVDLLYRKVKNTARVAVRLLHAMEKRYGSDVREVLKEMDADHDYPRREEAGEPERDLHDLLEAMEKSVAGSHRWERVLDEPDRVGYRFTSCLYSRVFRELGEPELGFTICAGDEPFVKSYDPRLGMKRTKVLMCGDDSCNHLYFVEK